MATSLSAFLGYHLQAAWDDMVIHQKAVVYYNWSQAPNDFHCALNSR